MNGLNPTTFLGNHGIPMSETARCPECHRPFKAYEGKLFFCDYVRYDTGEEEKGPMLFCSELCCLRWAELPPTGRWM